MEFKTNKQIQTYSFSPSINIVEKGKWLLGVISFECTHSVFIITNENTSFSITVPDHLETESDEKTFDELTILLELRSFELHVKVSKKRGNKIKLGDNEFELSDFDSKT